MLSVVYRFTSRLHGKLLTGVSEQCLAVWLPAESHKIFITSYNCLAILPARRPTDEPKISATAAYICFTSDYLRRAK